MHKNQTSVPIARDPQAFSQSTYDLIIVGGGIYGVSLCYEAIKRNLKPILLESQDFGAKTTFNCNRILHGGLRYLQSFDFHRFRESVAERKWFLKNFKGLVHPMPCLMPLYGKGLRRPSVLKAAGWINDLLSRKRNQGISKKNFLPNCQILDANSVAKIFSQVDGSGLRGGLLWYDAIMPDPHFLLLELLHKSVAFGGRALNYMRASDLKFDNNKICGIYAKDDVSGQTFLFKAGTVINASGPWSRIFASAVDKDYPKLFHRSLAWNVLFERTAFSDHALAVAPKQPNARTYFIVPWKGMLLVGTGHAPWTSESDNPELSHELLTEFLQDLNTAIPGLSLTHNDISHIFSGFLPAKEDAHAQLTKREVIIDHALHGGPNRLFSLAGVKFTTARLVAEKTLNLAFPNHGPAELKGFESFLHYQNEWTIRQSKIDESLQIKRESNWYESVKRIVQNESVVHLDDLCVRRTNLWEQPNIISEHSQDIKEALNWSDDHWQNELKRMQTKGFLGN